MPRPQADRPLAPMRLAFFDNTANNAYIQAKAFRRCGIEVDLLLDQHDRFVMSDPRWEDADLELATDRLADGRVLAAGAPPDAAWIRRPPDYRLRPRLKLVDHGGAGAVVLPRAAALAAGVAQRQGLRLVAMARRTIAAMREYDVVMGFGLTPAYARLAGVPCVMQAYGGDLTLVPFADTDERDCDPFHAGLARLQRWGIEASSAVVVSDPRYEEHIARLGVQEKSPWIPAVVDTERYSPGAEPELRATLAADDDTLVFVPSRQDWYWKGSDRILAGFARAHASDPSLRMVCSGWGADLDRSIALVGQLGIADRVRFLPHALSKRRLLRHLRAADVVIDQLALGSYGTSALEAMSSATPLVINLDRGRIESVFDTPPPVGQAATADEVAAVLVRLAGDPEDRAALGHAARDWVVAHHGDALVAPYLALCEQAFAASVSAAGGRAHRRASRRGPRTRRDAGPR
jgi:glycosyltransferase involved in cell wall biosynthesis